MRRKTKRFQISHARLLNFHFEFPRSTSLAVELIAADYSITRLYDFIAIEFKSGPNILTADFFKSHEWKIYENFRITFNTLAD